MARFDANFVAFPPEVYRGPGMKYILPEIDSSNIHDRPDRAPNISLNLHPKQHIWELVVVSAVGVLIQSGVLVFAAFTAYSSGLAQRLGGLPGAYAFPVLSAGTGVLVFGMWVCALVIGESTEEYIWEINRTRSPAHAKDPERGDEGKPGNKTCFRVFWIQKGYVVSDQSFDSFVLMAKGEKEQILTSVRNNDPPSTENAQKLKKDSQPSDTSNSPWLNSLSLVGTVTGIAGFVLQFEGFRGLSWACSIAQLVATLIMTILRAIVRRGMLDRPSAEEVTTDFEMDWLALRIGLVDQFLVDLSDSKVPICPRCARPEDHMHCEELLWEVCPQVAYPPTKELTESKIEESFQKAKTSVIITEKEVDSRPGSPKDTKSTKSKNNNDQRKAQTVVDIRKRLRVLTEWPAPPSVYATSVANAIKKVMEFSNLQLEEFTWNMDVQFQSDASLISGRVKLAVKKEVDKSGQKTSWKPPEEDIEAILSLWIYRFQVRKKTDEKSGGTQLTSDRLSPIKGPFRRVLGPHTPVLERDLAWWVGGRVADVLENFDWGQRDDYLNLGFHDSGKLLYSSCILYLRSTESLGT
jgi:hypothetical protein